jgi:hypothetical protein
MCVGSSGCFCLLVVHGLCNRRGEPCHKITQACIFTVVENVFESLVKYIDFWGAESKTELSFSLSRTFSPKSALSIISGMCTLG